MRAKQIKFERGKTPMDSLEIGYEPARIFRAALNGRDYTAPVLEPMLDSLKEGSVKERDAVRFFDGAFSRYYPRRVLSWYKYWGESGDGHWDKNREEFNLTFDMPEVEFFQITKYLKIICRIWESRSGNYLLESNLRITQDDGDIEDIFHNTNEFFPSDPIFQTNAVIHNISKTAETTIKNLL